MDTMNGRIALASFAYERKREQLVARTEGECWLCGI